MQKELQKEESRAFLQIPVAAVMCEEYLNSSAALTDQKEMPKG